jgi:hypothetical protein
MIGKFDGVPVEEDTNILFQQVANFGDYEVLYQKWVWDGITAESIIFDSKDVHKLSDDEVLEEVKSSPLLKLDTQITIKRTDDGYTFVNFNFEN